MKEELYTIPVTDAFAEDCECAFCAMMRTIDDKNVGFILSPSYMEESVRDQTNAEGFCPAHAERLAASKNALGVSLMMQSHLMTRRKELEALLEQAASEKKGRKSKDLTGAYREKLSGCYLCRINRESFERFLKAFFFLWKKEAGFRETVLRSKGFCLEHFLDLYDAAGQELLFGKTEEFRKALCELELANLSRVQGDLDWFILKFDYRYANEPWKESRNALPRTIAKLKAKL